MSNTYVERRPIYEVGNSTAVDAVLSSLNITPKKTSNVSQNVPKPVLSQHTSKGIRPVPRSDRINRRKAKGKAYVVKASLFNAKKGK